MHRTIGILPRLLSIIIFGGGGSSKKRFNTLNILDWNTK
jgi:hypothetical protein